MVAANCAEVEGVTSGVYTVNPTGMEPIDVYCDMDTSDGGWTVSDISGPIISQSCFNKIPLSKGLS